MRLIFLGPPGAGKGTHAQLLAEKLNLFRISTGDILRRNVKEETAMGCEAKEYMEKGALVPDEMVIQMTVNEIARAEANRGFIMDGFPRTLSQAQHLNEALAKLDSRIDLVINFETSEATIIERLSGRMICRSCGANYHLKNLPPRRAGVCDKCGGRLFHREDDEPETIKERLKVYEKIATGIINFYEEKGILETISGDFGLEGGCEALMGVLSKRGFI